ncbi:MAG TPA: competence/damage-inducible protein A [Gemmataceae bacterium]|nr:competence/damage-inducible protein A [Gemmataceae bacterium]
MKAEIISIGSELTSGQNLDTNSQWLSRRLAEIGIAVGWHTTVADDLDDNVAAFRIAAARARLVLVTGGLGPTQDDLTRDALALAAGVELVFHPESFEQIKAMFARRNRPMTERNRVQAMFPAGAEVIPNANGTAPGMWLKLGDCLLASMPGVPSEMYAMFESQVRPRLLALERTAGVVVQRKINCFGSGESAVEEKLLDLTRRGHVPEVGITVSDATISLRILAHAANVEEAQRQIAPVERTICERLGNLVFGFEDEDLQDAVARLLAEKRVTLATAESVTAGQVAERLARVPGVSPWLRGGVVAYDQGIKNALLGVPQELLDTHGAISAPVAEAMAVGARTRLRADLAVSTTGLAGPEGATPDKPLGLVYVGLAWEGGADAVSFNWGGTRLEVQSRTAKMALNRVRLRLLATEQGLSGS